MPELKTEINVKMDEEVMKSFDTLNVGIKDMKDETFSKINSIEKNLSEKIENNDTDLKSIEKKVNMLSVSNPEKKDGTAGFKNHIEFYNSVIEAGKHDNRLDKMPEKLAPLYNAVGGDEAKVSNDPDGGFLVPVAFLAGLLTTDPQAIQIDTGTRTRKIPMQADTVYINARVDKDHSSSVTGGFNVYRREEAAAVTASKAVYEQIKLQANSLMGLSYATEEVISRSPMSFAALIQTGFSDEKISKLNGERLWGTGVGEYTGVFNSPALVTVAKEGSQVADTIKGANLIKMRARAWRYGAAIWMANHDTYTQLTSAHIAGTNTDNYLFAPGNGVDVPDTLLGRPIVFDENAATLGDKGDISLINWNEYLEGMLGGITFMESVHVRFIYNERAFRFTIYNDGAPWWRTALTPKRSSSTLSPFVTLAERA